MTVIVCISGKLATLETVNTPCIVAKLSFLPSFLINKCNIVASRFENNFALFFYIFPPSGMLIAIDIPNEVIFKALYLKIVVYLFTSFPQYVILY